MLRIIEKFINKKVYTFIMNLYEIKELLSKQEKAVFSINEIARLLNIKKTVTYVYVNRIIRKKLLFKIERNKVSTSDDPFIVSSQLTFPSFISLTSALYLHNVMPQIIDRIYIITTRKKESLRIFDTNITFVNVKPEFMFGYKKIKKGKSFVMIADLEKTIIDCLKFPRYCRLYYVVKAFEKADVKKIEKYISILNNEVIARRIGFLLDILKKNHSLKRKTNIVYKLNPSIKKKGKFNKKWYLYINEKLI